MGTDALIPKMKKRASLPVFGLLVVGLLCWGLPARMPVVALAVERAIQFRPGFNLFSPAQDVQVGRENAAQADKQLPILKDSAVDQYVNTLGRRLASYSPNNRNEYVWAFKVVNSRDINAFALPGGYVYVNRGAVEAAQDEAQLAGVIAHEEGHVVMRHGTHQASEKILAQAPLAILGGVLGESGSLMSQLAQYGLGFGVTSVFLHNSRSIEAQADQVGTYTLYQAGYDPRAMAQFFEIIQQKYPQQTMEFFSDHPNPEHRIERVDEEVPQLGPRKAWKTDSPEFESVKHRLLGLPAPPKARPQTRSSAPSGPVPSPSDRLTSYRGRGFALRYPDNWQVQENQDNVVLAPSGGVWQAQKGESVQAYGASISRYDLQNEDPSLGGATRQLIDSMRQSNPNLRVIRQQGAKVSGRDALSTLLENDSPIQGEKEQDNLVTVRVPSGLVALVFIAPASAYDSYKPAFEAMLGSFELR